MATRKQTLEAEIASGHGDIEGKQAEIDRIDEQTAKAEQMQQNALASASSAVGTALDDAAEKSSEGKQTPAKRRRTKQPICGRNCKPILWLP